MISSTIEQRITKPKLVKSRDVKTVVWVINPGPIADVAIRNAEPNRADVTTLGVGDVDMFFFEKANDCFCECERHFSISMDAYCFGNNGNPFTRAAYDYFFLNHL